MQLASWPSGKSVNKKQSIGVKCFVWPLAHLIQHPSNSRFFTGSKIFAQHSWYNFLFSSAELSDTAGMNLLKKMNKWHILSNAMSTHPIKRTARSVYKCCGCAANMVQYMGLKVLPFASIKAVSSTLNAKGQNVEKAPMSFCAFSHVIVLSKVLNTRDLLESYSGLNLNEAVAQSTGSE
jgi:hypothetical protein